jgi:cyclopropane-fatty-acyl-phospholipid synthase
MTTIDDPRQIRAARPGGAVLEEAARRGVAAEPAAGVVAAPVSGAAGAAADLVERIRVAARPARGLSAFARRAVLGRLRRIDDGVLTLVEQFPGGETLVLGEPGPGRPAARLFVHDPAFYGALAKRGSVGAGEAYMAGHWGADDPAAVVRVLVRNRAALSGLNGGLARIARALQAVGNLRFVNTRAGSRRNIHAHYDLGNAFFELFLDETMTYSSGVFENARDDDEIARAEDLRGAQIAKLDRLCRKLRLQPTDHLLEIGTGWGSMAIHAASTYGCRVTTTTISREQHALARERVARAGLSDRVTVLLEDYRDLTGTYDKLVSVEMIEAVGSSHLDQYLEVCSARLAPHGAFALQAITIHDPDYERASRSVDFIKRYVFPGCFIPSTTAILEAARRRTDLRMRHAEDLAPHYARTLHLWRERFLAREAEVAAQGYDERFRRLWDWYLSYCEGGFAERYLGLQQMLFTKPSNREPLALGPRETL